METLRYDNEKNRLDLISPIFIEELGKVLTYGANKYAPNNWRFTGMDWSRCIGSLKRHLNEFEKGIDIDPESGLSHLAHIACNVMFLVEYNKTHPELDDRFKLKI